VTSVIGVNSNFAPLQEEYQTGGFTGGNIPYYDPATGETYYDDEEEEEEGGGFFGRFGRSDMF
jgi:hypothetical protein